MSGWPQPRYSKSQVKNAGDRIRGGITPLDGDAIILDNWRAAHGYLINTFQATLRTRIKQSGIPAIVAQRLKRSVTIIDKLKQGRATNLSNMQDIAGVRIVFNNM